jgi:hypothetical protein
MSPSPKKIVIRSRVKAVVDCKHCGRKCIIFARTEPRSDVELEEYLKGNEWKKLDGKEWVCRLCAELI